MHAALTFQPASLQTHFGGARGWMCLQTLRVKDVLPCTCTCHVLLQLFAERGRMLGLIFRPRLRFLSRGAVLNVRALFGKTNAKTPFLFCRAAEPRREG